MPVFAGSIHARSSGALPRPASALLCLHTHLQAPVALVPPIEPLTGGQIHPRDLVDSIASLKQGPPSGLATFIWEGDTVFKTSRGEEIFIVDGHLHLWDASPENQANKYGAGFIDRKSVV